jgi:serine/threonine-protein kinase
LSSSEESSAAPSRLGRYELIGQLATGGMAEIHLARLAGEAGFEKTVVVKRLLPELVASKAFVAMFLDEGKLVARINHPNVCEVHELGREGNEYFLVMPYLDGVPATDFIARPRDPDRIAQLRVATGIIVQACEGLHHAHELRGADGQPLGLVHRDVSPSNLMILTSGLVKVLDFGVAKVRGAAAETEVGTIKGKTQYMAPEQLLGEPLDRRCDVFALGIVLYELATHQRLFKRASDFLAAKAILEEDIPRADATDPAVPAALADVIAKALARKRDDRYADARALAKAIEAAMAPHGGAAASAPIADALAEWHGEELSALRTRQRDVLALAAGSNVATAPVARPPRPRARWLLPALLAVLGGGGVIAFFATRPSPFATHRTPAVADARPIDAAVDANIDAPAGLAATTDTGSDSGDEPTRPTHVAKKPGFLSIDSTPFATIYVDDKPFGVTPIVKKQLAAGRHRVRAKLEDGRVKDLKVDIPAGKLAAPVVLTW